MMPEILGCGKDAYIHSPTTNVQRITAYSATIPCKICCLPAVGQAKDGNYYCAYHMRQKFGFLYSVEDLKPTKIVNGTIYS